MSNNSDSVSAQKPRASVSIHKVSPRVWAASAAWSPVPLPACGSDEGNLIPFSERSQCVSSGNKQETQCSASIQVVPVTLLQKLLRESVWQRIVTFLENSVWPLPGKHPILPPYCLAEVRHVASGPASLVCPLALGKGEGTSQPSHHLSGPCFPGREGSLQRMAQTFTTRGRLDISESAPARGPFRTQRTLKQNGFLVMNSTLWL